MKEERIAFITDATTEFGRAIARELGSSGFRLALCTSAERDGAHIANQLSEHQPLVICSNLESPSAVEAVRDQIADRFARLDLVVHTQDRLIRVPIETCDDETFTRVIDENVRTAFWCTQVLGRYMGDQGSGQIVYISSIHDEKPTGSAFLYSASKGAIQMLCREAALDLGRRGLRVNLVEMGPILGDNERFESDLSDIYRNYERKVPSTELGTLEDVAHLVRFLASDDARFVNGAEIRMDGGFTLHYMDHKMKPTPLD